MHAKKRHTPGWNWYNNFFTFVSSKCVRRHYVSLRWVIMTSSLPELTEVTRSPYHRQCHMKMARKKNINTFIPHKWGWKPSLLLFTYCPDPCSYMPLCWRISHFRKAHYFIFYLWRGNQGKNRRISEASWFTSHLIIYCNPNMLHAFSIVSIYLELIAWIT